MCELSVIIPVFNESESIFLLNNEILGAVSKLDVEYEIIFVNDASNDGSRIILDSLAATNELIRVIHISVNSGQSFALKQGIDASTGRLIAFLDSDLQNNPADLISMYPLMDACDVVLGYRGKRMDSFWRKATSEIGNLTIRLLFGVSVIDSGCTLRIGKAYVFKQLPFFNNFHRYINLMIQKKGWKVVDYKTNHRKRLSGNSKYGPLKPFKICIELIQLKLREDKIFN